MRVHSTRDPLNDRRPWLYSEEFTAGARKAYALRAALVPYLYTASREAFDDGLGLLRPMYLQYPKAEEAYQVPGQFMVGQDLIMAPAARAGFGPQKVVHVRAWLPEGDWYLWDSHERFSGPLETVVPVPLDGVALFVRGGAAITLNAPGSPQACASNGPLQVRVYPGAAASRELYEDDGESIAYQAGAFRRTALSTRPLPDQAWPSAWPPAKAALRGPAPRALTWSSKPRPGWKPPRSSPAGKPSSRPLVDAPVSDLYNEMLGDSARVALAALQLDAALPQRAEAQALAARHQKLLGDFRAHAAVAALRKDSLDLQDAYDSLMFALGDLGQAGEAAFRVLAGVSFFAQVVNDKDKGYRLQLELRRDASAVQATAGPCQARWRWDKAAQGQHGQFELGRACISEWQTDVQIDRASLALIKGEAGDRDPIARPPLRVLREPFFWDGRTVKGLGHPGPAADRDPLRTLASLDLTGWAVHRFDPSRVARGLRHFYDFGKLFHCPDGACYAASVVEAEAAGEAAFSFHQEGQAQVWVNGQPSYTAGTPRFTVALEQGPNQVLIRIADFRNEHGRGPALSVEAAEGSPVGALRFKAPDTDKALTSKQP